MPLILLIILAGLPLADIILAIGWLLESPLVALLYFTAMVFAGVFLIRLAKVAMGEVLRVLQEERLSPALFVGQGFAKLWFAGALLVFPGYLTDIIAALLVLLAVLGWMRGDVGVGGGGVGEDGSVGGGVRMDSYTSTSTSTSTGRPEIELEAEVVEQEESSRRRDERD